MPQQCFYCVYWHYPNQVFLASSLEANEIAKIQSGIFFNFNFTYYTQLMLCFFFFYDDTLVFAIFTPSFLSEASKQQASNILPNSEQINFSNEYSLKRLGFFLLCYIATVVGVTTNTGVLLDPRTPHEQFFFPSY